VTFSAPRVGPLPGIWRVEASWEAQTYITSQAGTLRNAREENAHAGLKVANWLTSKFRYELGVGVDEWSGIGRAASVGGSIERKALSDRASLSADATIWVPRAEAAFGAVGTRAAFRSSPHRSGTIYLAEAGVESVSSTAPLQLWPGAGEGRVRRPLLRGHTLLNDDIVGGAIFGRQVGYGSFEMQYWLPSSLPAGFGFATFIDAAHASRRAAPELGAPQQVDAGIGLRLKLPGRERVLRIDYGRGLRDGQQALSIGWGP
jgi:hypothetical protein